MSEDFTFIPVTSSQSEIQVQNVLHTLLVGLSGLDKTLVRPAYQPKPPKTPDLDVTWCAFDISDDTEDAAQMIQGVDQAQIHTEDVLSVRITVYGPGSRDLCKQIKRGLHVPDNLVWLRRHHMALVSIGTIVRLAEEHGGTWLARSDLPLTLRIGTAATDGIIPIYSLQPPNVEIKD